VIASSIHKEPPHRDDRSACNVEQRRPGGPDPDRWADSVRASPFDPRPDVKRVYTDANQVCWNKAKLRRAKADYANNRAVEN
jgi:hypothetical protein